MAYDAGAAVGYLQLDIIGWQRNLQMARNSLAKFGTDFRTMMRGLRLETGRLEMSMRMASIKSATQAASIGTVAQVAPLAAGTSIGGVSAAASQRIIAANLMNEALARKAQSMSSISAIKMTEEAAATANAASIINLKNRVAQEKAIVIDGARSQNRATLMEARHGYRLAEIAARQTATGQVSAFTRIKQAGVNAFNSIGTTMTRLRYGAQLIATTFVVSFGLMAWQLSKLLGGFAEFEQRMRKATSVTKYTEDEFRVMSAEAETAAKKWGTPARDAADAFLFLGRAGLTAQQQLAAMPSITAASKAMMEDLEETAEGTVNIMNAFNLSFDQTPKVVDMMTEAVNSSTMNLHEFLVSLSYAAKPAAAFNNTMQDTAAMIGIAANAGIRGSKAGTALRYALTQLSAPTSGMKRLMRELHLQIYDTSGAMIPFVDIMQQIQDKLVGATEQTRNYTLKTLFGQRALSTMIALFEKGAVGIREYSNQIARAAGVTETTAQKQMMAMKSQLEKLRETWEALKRHIVQSFAPDVTRAIKTIISHVDDWTTAIDNNQERVRNFAKEILGFFVQFAKITAGMAAFALLARVLGGIVMILQAILSPLGAIVIGIALAYTAWETNFLRMRDIGHTVFEFLKKDALGFFATVIDGMWKLAASTTNWWANAVGLINIKGLTANIVATINAVHIGDKVAEAAQREMYQIFTHQGTIPLKQGVEEALRGSRTLYESAKGYWTKPGVKQIGDTTFLQELLAQAKWSQTPNVQETITDLWDASASLSKAYEEGWPEFVAKLKTGAGSVADVWKVNLDAITAMLKEMFPADWLSILDKLKALLGDIASGKEVGGQATGLQRKYKEPLLRSLYTPGLLELDLDAWVRAHADLIGRVRILYKDFLDAYTDDWNAAIGAVTDTFKTQIGVMSDMFQFIQTGWSDALDDLMKQGSSFIDFMDSFFQTILAGFRQMVAEMLSISMFEAIFGKGTGRKRETPEVSIPWGAIWSGIKYLATGKFETPGITVPSGENSYSPGLDYDDVSSWRDDSQKIAPKIAFVVQNNTGVNVTAKAAAPPVYDGKQWVLNVVMEESLTNPRFGEIIRGGV